MLYKTIIYYLTSLTAVLGFNSGPNAFLLIPSHSVPTVASSIHHSRSQSFLNIISGFGSVGEAVIVTGFGLHRVRSLSQARRDGVEQGVISYNALPPEAGTLESEDIPGAARHDGDLLCAPPSSAAVEFSD
jgi:hypothetical protein